MAQDPENRLGKVSSFEELFAEAERHPDYWVERAILEFTDEMLRQIKTLGLSRSELADKLGQSKPRISRLLSGQNNFTLRTMVEVSRALDCELRLHLQPDGTQTAWVDYGHQGRRVKVVTAVTCAVDSSQTFTRCPALGERVRLTFPQTAVSSYVALPASA